MSLLKLDDINFADKVILNNYARKERGLLKKKNDLYGIFSFNIDSNKQWNQYQGLYDKEHIN